MMKKIRNIFVLYLLVGLTLPGCNSFLDVHPKGEVVNDKMFEDLQGFRDAMYGVYATLGSPDLYGENLTWGFAEQLSHLFYAPVADLGGSELFGKIASYDYTHPDVKAKINTIWGKSYKAISYLNNILTQLEEKDLEASFEYRWIAGEAHGLRAFLHFDVLRWFAENILNNPTAGGIPYAYTFDLKNKELFTLEESYQNVLEDLTIAQHLLADDTNRLAEQEYRKERYNFMNLSAVHAVKARVFQARGQVDSAAFYAHKVIDSKLFDLITSPTNLATAKKYPGNSELILGLERKGLYDAFYNLFLKTTATNFDYLLPRTDCERIYKDVSFTAENHDYRWDEYFNMQKASEDDKSQERLCFVRFLNVNTKDPEDVEKQKTNTKGVSLIRLPEMYYILAEAICEQDLSAAWSYLNDVRKSRGLTIPLTGDLSAFKDALQQERIKELWGDGQVFMDYKRKNAKFLDAQQHEYITMTDKIGVFPWPDNEKEYGYTNK